MFNLKCITNKKKRRIAMALREKVRKKKDRKIFRKTAIRTKQINQRQVTPRGGIRL